MRMLRNLGAISAAFLASSLVFGAAQSPQPIRAGQIGGPPLRSTDRDEGNVVISKILGRNTQVCKKATQSQIAKGEGEVFVRYTIERPEHWRANKMKAQTLEASRHPNHAMPLIAVKHRDGVCTIDAEFADAGNLMTYNLPMPPHMREISAKSVFRQLVTGLHYFKVVHELTHRDINPSTVFLRRDGCVKLGFFDIINPTLVQNNPDWYLRTPFCPPEIYDMLVGNQNQVANPNQAVNRYQAVNQYPLANQNQARQAAHYLRQYGRRLDAWCDDHVDNLGQDPSYTQGGEVDGLGRLSCG